MERERHSNTRSETEGGRKTEKRKRIATLYHNMYFRRVYNFGSYIVSATLYIIICAILILIIIICKRFWKLILD